MTSFEILREEIMIKTPQCIRRITFNIFELFVQNESILLVSSLFFVDREHSTQRH